MEKQIEFLKPYGSYMKGWIAVFPDHMADAMVRNKVAKPFVPKLGMAPKRDALKQMIKKSK